MDRKQAWFGAAVIVALTVLAGCAAPARQAAPPAASPQLSNTVCAADLTAAATAVGRTVQCATLAVAQDRRRPDGKSVTMPVIVVRPAQAGAEKTPMMYLHGGPGGSVTPAVARLIQSPTARDVFPNDRAVVFFDQRGAGGSSPRLDCGELSLTDAGIANDADLTAFGQCVQRLAAEGVDFAFYNAKVIADDVQDLAAALKMPSFDLFGVSYGTRIALAVAQYRPQGVRAMILDSPYPPEAKGTEELPRITAEQTRHLLRTSPGLADRFAARLAAWERTPPPGVTVDDVGQYLVDLLYSASGVANFKMHVTALVDGDLRLIQEFIAGRSGYDEAQNIAHFCKEELPFESVEKMRASAAADPIARAVAAPAARYFKACDSMIVGAPEPMEIKPYTGAIPALFLVAGIDPGCALSFNEPAANAMPNAQLVAFMARTHGVTRLSPCARSMMQAFLADPMKPLDRDCLKQEPPAL
jgi:pimeloyl-ACP methyl ester carboxylesterase